MPFRFRRSIAAVTFAGFVAASPGFAGAATPLGAPALRTKLFSAYQAVRSYRVTVLGSVRSLGVWNAPNKYQMTTDFGGKPVETIIIGHDYWMLSDGKWQKSGTASNNLEVDISGLIRTAKANPSVPLVPMPDQMQDGKRVGTFAYTFASGTQDVCNYNPATFLVTRCKADELTLLYSAYNAKTNVVANP